MDQPSLPPFLPPYPPICVGILDQGAAELFRGEVHRAIVAHHDLDADGLAAGLEQAWKEGGKGGKEGGKEG